MWFLIVSTLNSYAARDNLLRLVTLRIFPKYVDVVEMEEREEM